MVNGARMKIAIWTYIPSHHQAGFFQALREQGVDLVVRYCDNEVAHRVHQGWVTPELASGELSLAPDRDLFADMPDWQTRIHIVAGYGLPALRKVIWQLCSAKVSWVHWTEHPRLGTATKHFLMYPLRRMYGRIVDRFALGALAISRLAADSFLSWGISPDRIAILPYSVSSPIVAGPDSQCQEFTNGRKSFIFLGFMDDRKAIDILIQAFSMATSACTDWVLLLVGGAKDLASYKDLCVSLSIGKQVLFRGVIPSSSIGSVLSVASVCVLPSRG